MSQPIKSVAGEGNRDEIGSGEACHRYDFLVRLWNGLNFFELFKLLFFTWD